MSDAAKPGDGAPEPQSGEAAPKPEPSRDSELPPPPLPRASMPPQSPEELARERRIQRRINIVGTVEIALAVILFILLAAPWVDVPAYGTTYGYDLPNVLHAFDKLDGNLKGIHKGNFNPFLLIYLLPVFCVALMVRELRGTQAHTLAAAAASVPVAAIAYAVGVAGLQVFPLLRIAAWAAIVICLILTGTALYGIRIGYGHDRALRARMAVGILGVATPVCYVLGWLNR